MISGRMDRQIIIKKKTVTTDSFGGVIETWSDVSTVWANVQYLRGAERYAAKQTVASIDVKFKIWWRRDVGVENIIEYDGNEYDTYACLELGRREGLELHAGARAE